MDIMELVKDHDLYHGPFIPMNSNQENVEFGSKIFLQDPRNLPILLHNLVKKNPPSVWGIRPTLQWKRRSVSRKQKRLILQQLVDSRLLFNLEIDEIVDIMIWMSIEKLTSELLRGLPNLFYLKDKTERQLIGVSLCLLKYGDWSFRETELGLNWQDLISTSNLSGYKLSTSATYWSRNQIYFFGNWLNLRLDVVADPNTPGPGIPYSSYCKGYGMDRGSSRESLTPYSAELDGEEEEVDMTMIPEEDHELATFLFFTEISTW